MYIGGVPAEHELTANLYGTQADCSDGQLEHTALPVLGLACHQFVLNSYFVSSRDLLALKHS